MGLVLTIENESALADGGPLTYTVEGRRGFDIGRDAHLDWTLPDPSRYISSRHCEVRYTDGGYWLHDVSTNGTYLNGSDLRMSEPHRLRDGDRLAIGHYLIRVTLTGQTSDAPPAVAKPAPARKPAADVWAIDDGQAATPAPSARSAPAQARSFVPEGAPPSGSPDFMDWAADVPALEPRPIPSAPPRARAQDGGRPRELPPADEGWWDVPTERAPQRQPHAQPAAEAPQQAAPQPLPKPTPASERRAEPVAAPPQEAQPQAPRKPAQPAPDRAAPFGEPRPVAVPQPASAASPQPRADSAQFMRAFAEGAGMNPADLSHHDPETFARTLGGLVRLTADELRQLLEARFEAKRMARSSQQTQISGTDNNPLKFSPTVEDALRLMLGPPTRGYLGANKAVESSFKDIKTHQLETYAAMQGALIELANDFDPKQIDASLGRDGGFGNLVSSRKARAWDVFVARWEAKTLRQDNGILGAFMEFFSKHYDREKK